MRAILALRSVRAPAGICASLMKGAQKTWNIGAFTLGSLPSRAVCLPSPPSGAPHRDQRSNILWDANTFRDMTTRHVSEERFWTGPLITRIDFSHRPLPLRAPSWLDKHLTRPGSFYFPTLVGYGLFPVTLAVLAALSKDSSPAWAFILVVFLCGLTTGATQNYDLAHLLHITPKETHYVATALLATFRGFAGSFGAAIGGGLFPRTLDGSLKGRFADQGMERAALIRRLLGSPALVEQLDGVEKQIAVAGYQDALKLLWLSMALIAVAMLFVQAGVGPKWDAEKHRLEGERQSLLNEAQR
ncbi:uncharacterized protein MYCFIDRAFT_169680 [Pseudocercospora fijiensis CIRAD86]|uniref:Major facilitator superfamily (MFS) profile domain-containing protein n=1 Tax=Pseudocercospora fijiensis (strain CIRAD86) TaxID=383855 RepID=N1Q852_PSEFD|nr:uncharacterized protein MYCFIDRAFT_169680 [Pseudocercospora fijiensis CIRAD86]EME87951.1 hypothetical protein MYCFIDRAFT_169680 [Pseudocercospora fijiensis CIRAD86]